MQAAEEWRSRSNRPKKISFARYKGGCSFIHLCYLICHLPITGSLFGMTKCCILELERSWLSVKVWLKKICGTERGMRSQDKRPGASGVLLPEIICLNWGAALRSWPEGPSGKGLVLEVRQLACQARPAMLDLETGPTGPLLMSHGAHLLQGTQSLLKDFCCAT